VKDTEASRPRFFEAFAASIICSTAHFCRAFGLPCTDAGAKPSNCLVIGRMHGDELALQMGRQFGDLDAGVGAQMPFTSSQ
jgi:hypothetical protein